MPLDICAFVLLHSLAKTSLTRYSHIPHNTTREHDYDRRVWRFRTDIHITWYGMYPDGRWMQGDIFIVYEAGGRWRFMRDDERMDPHGRGLEIWDVVRTAESPRQVLRGGRRLDALMDERPFPREMWSDNNVTTRYYGVDLRNGNPGTLVTVSRNRRPIPNQVHWPAPNRPARNRRGGRGGAAQQQADAHQHNQADGPVGQAVAANVPAGGPAIAPTPNPNAAPGWAQIARSAPLASASRGEGDGASASHFQETSGSNGQVGTRAADGGESQGGQGGDQDNTGFERSPLRQQGEEGDSIQLGENRGQAGRENARGVLRDQAWAGRGSRGSRGGRGGQGMGQGRGYGIGAMEQGSAEATMTGMQHRGTQTQLTEMGNSLRGGPGVRGTGGGRGDFDRTYVNRPIQEEEPEEPPTMVPRRGGMNGGPPQRGGTNRGPYPGRGRGGVNPPQGTPTFDNDPPPPRANEATENDGDDDGFTVVSSRRNRRKSSVHRP